MCIEFTMLQDMQSLQTTAGRCSYTFLASCLTSCMQDGMKQLRVLAIDVR